MCNEFSTVVTLVSEVFKSPKLFGFLCIGVPDFLSRTGETEWQKKTLTKVSLEMHAFTFWLPCFPLEAFL